MARAGWLTDADELPHAAGEDAPASWSENYLSYVWSPANEVGIYVHLARRVVPFELWDEAVNIALPGDRYVMAKAFGPGRPEHGAAVNAVRMRCEEPYERWTKQFVGAGRLVDGDAYRSGPLADGEHVPVTWEVTFTATSPPFDFGMEHLDQAWGQGHYEQHGTLRGTLVVGDERHEIDGTGLRDHSWGPRDYREIGTTTWLHAQFPASGRSLMAVLVTGRPPRPPFSVATVGDHRGVRHVRAEGLPEAHDLAATQADYAFTLIGDDLRAQITAEVLKPLRAACAGPAELVLGTHRPPGVNHHYVDAFTRFSWDGETGYGITERTVDLAGPEER